MCSITAECWVLHGETKMAFTCERWGIASPKAKPKASWQSALGGNSQSAAREGDIANLLEEAEERGSSSVSSVSKMLIGILVLTHLITCRFVLCAVSVAELISTISCKQVVRMWNPYGTVYHFLDYVPKPDRDAGVCHWLRWFYAFLLFLWSHWSCSYVFANTLVQLCAFSSDLQFPLHPTLPDMLPFHV